MTEVSTIPSVRIGFDNGHKVSQILETVLSVANEVNVTLDDKGLNIREMDHSRVAMVTLSLAKAAMQEYNLGGETKVRFRITIKDFKNLKLKPHPVTFTFNFKDYKCLVEQQKPYTRAFTVPFQKSEGEDSSPLKANFDATIKMTLSTIRTIIEDAQLCSDHIRIQALPDKLSFNIVGDLLTYCAEILRGNQELLEFSANQAATAFFSLSFLGDITSTLIKLAEITGEVVSLRLKTDFPVVIETEPKDPYLLCLSYAIAPRIEQE